MARFSFQRMFHELDHVFTDKEAWFLFRAAAFMETVGWCLLIIGIVWQVKRLNAYDYVLPIAGSLHGIFYIMYVLIVFFTHRSLGWSVWRFLLAEAISVIPFGALVLEKWVATQRRSTLSRHQS